MSNTIDRTGEFALHKPFEPAGDQPQAIEKLVQGVQQGLHHQTLLGATGTGKTYTVANVIAQVKKPTLVIAHNKTLAAQLAQEYSEFFPENAVHYFVSYYDFYQPEAYMPVSDTYIEKEAMINKEIERLRHASTEALLTRNDVIVIASVSCIYGLGNPDEYKKVNLKISVGAASSRTEFIRELVHVYFARTNADLEPGLFRARGNMVEVMPTSERTIYRIVFGGAGIEQITELDPITRSVKSERDFVYLFPARHFITPEDERKRASSDIRAELKAQLTKLEKQKKVLEYERIKRRTNHDLALINEVGYCNGIENYSRHFDGRKKGEPPYTLLSYFPHNPDGSPDFLTVIDESHVTVPQIGGMYAGDRSRKETLISYGFRLPSALDNRPLQFDEFEERVGQTIYTSATPAKFERELANTEEGALVEQMIRPTGLLDPELVVRSIISSGTYEGQVKDFIAEAEKTVAQGERILVTTLTKKMAEDLAEFLRGKKVKAEYLHSDIKTIDRIEILTKFRKGEFDVLVGVNLLREGLDLPEVSLVGILDADKEGFLRSETSLVQTIGRAARNVNGRVILYADNTTGSMEAAINETRRRRGIQKAYNKQHNITPKTITKAIKDIAEQLRTDHDKAVHTLLSVDAERYKKNPKKVITQKTKLMNEAVKNLDFETAALIRDEIRALQKEIKK